MHSWVLANPAFENVVDKEHFLGVVPHPRTGPNADALRQIDRTMAENILVNSELYLYYVKSLISNAVVCWCRSSAFAAVWVSGILFVRLGGEGGG